MSNKTREGIRPVFLVAALGVVAMLAILAAVALPSGSAQAQANPFLPPDPTAVTATAADDGSQVMVSWTPGTGGTSATGYEVERKVGDGSYEGADPAHSGTTPSYTDSNVTAGETYTYQVRATNSFGTSLWVVSNSVTPTAAADPNQPPEVVGGVLGDISLLVRQSHGPVDVSAAFTDPDEDDTLVYDASSDNTAVANASIAGSQMTIVAGNFRGTARITVTATDDDGATASTSFDVAVAEAYTLMADPYGDPMLPEAPTDPADDRYIDPDVPANLRTIPHSAVFVVEPGEDGYPAAYDATFNLEVAGSRDAVTVTVTATEIVDISITDSDGLIGAGFVDEEETDLEGSLTIQPTDDNSRSFQIEGECLSPGGWAHIAVEDKDLERVTEGAIYCKAPKVEVPDDDEFRSDIMTVVSYNDWDHWEMYETVSDGFLIDDPDNNVEHMVNQDSDNNMMGILVRDEPVVDSYQLAISEKEMLTLMAGEDPDRLTKAEAEAGQHTIEVMVGAQYVQLTVTSTMEGPAYIRFLDSDMMPFDTDVDEEPAWRGADVKGLDEGRLELNLTTQLSKAKALAYDQYRVVIPGAADGYAYLDGIGGDYHQGTFRFFNPCPSEGHYFYVEVRESEGKYLKTTEKVMCVLSPRPGPTGLEFTIDSDLPGEGVLKYRPARNSISHDVLLIDASNRNIVTTVEDAASPVMFDNLNNGWTYHIVVIAEGVNGQYTARGVTDYGVRWLGRADVPLSTDPPATPTRMHPLCQVDDADLQALLADCDVNTAPMAVGSIAAQTVMAGQSVMVDVASNFSDADMGDSLTYTAMSDMMSYATASVSGSMVTIMGVAPGAATITVTATDMHGEMAMQTIMVTVTAAMLTAPSNVMATVDDSDPGAADVTITWTNGMNADGHEVGLVDLSDYSVRDHRVTDGATSHTFTNVASGRYMAIVVSTMDAEYDYDVAIVTVP